MKARTVLVVVTLASFAQSANPKASPCLGKSAPKKGVSLATLKPGATVYLHHDDADGVTVEEDGPAFTVCIDDAPAPPVRSRFVAQGRGLAVSMFAAPAALVNIPLSNWKDLRRRVKEDAGQTGCLKKLPVGTALHEEPDGEVVGQVIDASIPYGKWDSAEGGWSMLKVNLGFGPFEVWVKDGAEDWCP